GAPRACAPPPLGRDVLPAAPTRAQKGRSRATPSPKGGDRNASSAPTAPAPRQALRLRATRAAIVLLPPDSLPRRGVSGTRRIRRRGQRIVCRRRACVGRPSAGDRQQSRFAPCACLRAPESAAPKAGRASRRK